MPSSRRSRRIPTCRPYCLGIDDGFFSLDLKRRGVAQETALVGVVTRGTSVEAVFSTRVMVDALDATSRALEIVLKALSLYPIEAVLLDGVTYAGFNIVNPFAIHALTGVGIIVAFRYPLDLSKVARALIKHFKDWRLRLATICNVYSRARVIEFDNGTKIMVSCIGIPRDPCIELVKRLTVWKPNPEPLRIADLIASAMGRKIFEKRMNVAMSG